MDKILHTALAGLLTLNLTAFASGSAGLDSQNPDPIETLSASEPIHTESRFVTKIEAKTEIIPKNTAYKDDPGKETGTEKVLDEGADGKIVRTYKVEVYDGEEFSRELISTDQTDPQDKNISRGTKIVWHTLDTPSGPIQFRKKMRVYATHYDSHCPGCDDTTAIGMHAGKGVIAVDPSVVKLRSRLYIPEYGMAIAGDTGGAIRGNMVDLGFDDARTAGWTAHYIDIYLL